MLESFLPTMLGALIGVTGSFSIERWAQYRAYKRFLNAAFVRCDHYLSMLNFRKNAVLTIMNSDSNSNKGKLGELVKLNIDPPENFADHLVKNYGKYIRPHDISLISQCESNMDTLYRALIRTDMDENGFHNYIGKLKEESARRCWIIHGVAWRHDHPFCKRNYNALVALLQENRDNEITKINVKRVLDKAQQSHAADARATHS